MTPTPKSKLTLDEILIRFGYQQRLRERTDFVSFLKLDPELAQEALRMKPMSQEEAKAAISILLRELVPESPNWKTDPEAKVYAEGFAACREQMLKNLEGLWAK